MLNGTRVIPSLDEEWSDYKVGGNKRMPIRNNILIKVHFSTEFDIDIPDNMRRFDPKEKLESPIEHWLNISLLRLDQYCSTLAHKANHSFLPNTIWGRMDHPQ